MHPTEFWFFPNRAAALESTSLADVDVLTHRDALLGRAVADVAASPDAVGHVALTMHGLIGDSGWRRRAINRQVVGAEPIVGHDDVRELHGTAVFVFSGSDVTALASVIPVGARSGASLCAYTYNCGWFPSPPPFSLTT
jgi:hypothetical protein